MPFRNIPQSSSTPIFENPLNANGWGEEKVGRCWTVAFKTQDNQPNEKIYVVNKQAYEQCDVSLYPQKKYLSTSSDHDDAIVAKFSATEEISKTYYFISALTTDTKFSSSCQSGSRVALTISTFPSTSVQSSTSSSPLSAVAFDGVGMWQYVAYDGNAEGGNVWVEKIDMMTGREVWRKSVLDTVSLKAADTSYTPTSLTVSSITYDSTTSTLYYTGTFTDSNTPLTRLPYLGRVTSSMVIPTIYAQVLDPKNAGIKTIDAKGVAVTDGGLAVLAGCNQEINADYEGSPRADTRCKENNGEECNWWECIIYAKKNLDSPIENVRSIKPSNANLDVLPSFISPQSVRINSHEVIFVSVNTPGYDPLYSLQGPSLLPPSSGEMGAVVQMINVNYFPTQGVNPGSTIGPGEGAFRLSASGSTTLSTYVNYNVVKGTAGDATIDVYVTGSTDGWLGGGVNFNIKGGTQGFIAKADGMNLGAGPVSLTQLRGNGDSVVIGAALSRDRILTDPTLGTSRVVIYGVTDGTMDYSGCTSSGGSDVFFISLQANDLNVIPTGRSCAQLGGTGDDTGVPGGIYAQTKDGVGSSEAFWFTGTTTGTMYGTNGGEGGGRVRGRRRMAGGGTQGFWGSGLTSGLIIPPPINPNPAASSSALSLPSVVLIGVFLPLVIIIIVLGSYLGGKKTAYVAFAKMKDEQEGEVGQNGNVEMKGTPGIKTGFHDNQLSPGEGGNIGNEESLASVAAISVPTPEDYSHPNHSSSLSPDSVGSETPTFEGGIITGTQEPETEADSKQGGDEEDGNEVFHEVGNSASSADML